MYNTFICYRRDGGDALAHLLYDRLRQKKVVAFLDMESLRSGKFNTMLLKIMDECKNVLVVLPPHALDRCENEDDWVRIEIRHAIQTNKNIIPIMLKGFEFPKTLPADIEEIRNYNGITSSSEYFDAVIDKLINMLILRSSERWPVWLETNKKILRHVIVTSLALLLVIAASYRLFAGKTEQTSDNSSIKASQRQSQELAGISGTSLPKDLQPADVKGTSEPSNASVESRQTDGTTSIYTNLSMYADSPFSLFDSPTISKELTKLLGDKYEYFLTCLDSINYDEESYDSKTGSLFLNGGVAGLYSLMEACINVDKNGDISVAFLNGGLVNPGDNDYAIHYYGNNASNRNCITSDKMFSWILKHAIISGSSYDHIVFCNASSIPLKPTGNYNKQKLGACTDGSFSLTSESDNTYSFLCDSFYGAHIGEATGEITISDGHAIYSDTGNPDDSILFSFAGDYVTVVCRNPTYYGGLGADLSGCYKLKK